MNVPTVGGNVPTIKVSRSRDDLVRRLNQLRNGKEIGDMAPAQVASATLEIERALLQSTGVFKDQNTNQRYSLTETGERLMGGMWVSGPPCEPMYWPIPGSPFPIRSVFTPYGIGYRQSQLFPDGLVRDCWLNPQAGAIAFMQQNLTIGRDDFDRVGIQNSRPTSTRSERRSPSPPSNQLDTIDRKIAQLNKEISHLEGQLSSASVSSRAVAIDREIAGVQAMLTPSTMAIGQIEVRHNGDVTVKNPKIVKDPKK